MLIFVFENVEDGIGEIADYFAQNLLRVVIYFLSPWRNEVLETCP